MTRLILAAAVLAAAPALAQSEGTEPDGLLERFLLDRGEDIEACFGDIPQMEVTADPGPFLAADIQDEVAPRQLVLAFDASGSMAARLGRGTRMEAARRAVDGLLGGLPDDVGLGLVAFGHRGTNDEADRAESCAGVETLVTEGDAAALQAAVGELDPTGWTPLAEALRRAGEQLAAEGQPGEQVVYVVSDGEETCGGDPVAEARALHDSEIRAVVHVLGLDLPTDERAQLEAVASAGGGLFTDVRSESDLVRSIEELQRRNANFARMLRAGNAAVGTQLRNSNHSAGALLRLDNCISGRSLRESNRLQRWARDQGLDTDGIALLRDRLKAGHDAYRERAAEIRMELEAERDSVNEEVQRRLEDAEAEFQEVQ